MIGASGGKIAEIVLTTSWRATGSVRTRPAIPLRRSASGISANTAL
jgi:hypothetical protein